MMLSAFLIPISKSLWCIKGIDMKRTIFGLYETGAEQQMNEAYHKKVAQVSSVIS